MKRWKKRMNMNVIFLTKQDFGYKKNVNKFSPLTKTIILSDCDYDFFSLLIIIQNQVRKIIFLTCFCGYLVQMKILWTNWSCVYEQSRINKRLILSRLNNERKIFLQNKRPPSTVNHEILIEWSRKNTYVSHALKHIHTQKPIQYEIGRMNWKCKLYKNLTTHWSYNVRFDIITPIYLFFFHHYRNILANNNMNITYIQNIHTNVQMHWLTEIEISNLVQIYGWISTNKRYDIHHFTVSNEHIEWKWHPNREWIIQMSLCVCVYTNINDNNPNGIRFFVLFLYVTTSTLES